MAVRFALIEFGRSFATRGRGMELRQEVLDRAGESTSVVVDLTGVDHMSYSFADEFSGKLSIEERLSVDFEGATAVVRRVVEDAVRRRQTTASSC